MAEKVAKDLWTGRELRRSTCTVAVPMFAQLQRPIENTHWTHAECPIYPSWLLGKRHACVRARSCVYVRIDVHSPGRGAGNGNGRMSEQTNAIYTLKRGSGTSLCGARPW